MPPYLAFDIPLEQTAEGVAALKTLGVGGFNVTMPDKTAVAGIVDELSPAAKLIGACNTVTVGEDGRLTGHNTDGIGFVRNLREHGVEVRGQKLVGPGAGRRRHRHLRPGGPGRRSGDRHLQPEGRVLPQRGAHGGEAVPGRPGLQGHPGAPGGPRRPGTGGGGL